MALYHVPHNATRNEHPRGSPRLQLYFRVTNQSRMQRGAIGSEHALLDIWSDWEGLQNDLCKLRAVVPNPHSPVNELGFVPRL
eukprot:SAG31_NODE_1798_length_7243_cov_4.509518_3_plen_83_part_00